MGDSLAWYIFYLITLADSSSNISVLTSLRFDRKLDVLK